MDFLEKLDFLMNEARLNKSTLSKACDIPYTTIDGWYKKGYEGLKLTTLRKLANYFGTSLDYWASNKNEKSPAKAEASTGDERLDEIVEIYHALNDDGKDYLHTTAGHCKYDPKYKKCSNFEDLA